MTEIIKSLDRLGDQVLQKEEISLLLKLKDNKYGKLDEITKEFGKKEFIEGLKTDIKDINSIKDPSLKAKIEKIYKTILKKLGDPDWNKEILPYSKTAQSSQVQTPEVIDTKDSLSASGVSVALSETAQTKVGEDANVGIGGQNPQNTNLNDNDFEAVFGEISGGLNPEMITKIKDGNFLRKEFVEAYIRHIKYQNDVDLIKIFPNKDDIKGLDEYFKTQDGIILFNSTLDKLGYEDFISNLGLQKENPTDAKAIHQLPESHDKEQLMKEFYDVELKGFFVKLKTLQDNLNAELNQLIQGMIELNNKGQLTGAEGYGYSMIINEKYMKLDGDVKKIMGGLAQKYANFLVDVDSDFVTKGERSKLSLGNFDIILNFDTVKNQLNNTQDKLHKKQIIAQNMSNIYRDTDWKHLGDAVKKSYADYMKNPAKGQVDLLSIVAGGLVATAVAGTLAAGTPVLLTLGALGLAFTTTNKIVKGVGYGALASQNGEDVGVVVYEGIGVEMDKNGNPVDLSTNMVNNGVELTTNSLMFGMFEGMNFLGKGIKLGEFESILSKNAFNTIKGFGANTAYQGAKIGVEAIGLTEVGTMAQGVKTVVNGKIEKSYNFKEMSDKFNETYGELHKSNNFLDAMAYNYLMIGLIKTTYSGLPEITDRMLQDKEGRQRTEIIIGNQQKIQDFVKLLEQRGCIVVFRQQENGKFKVMVGGNVKDAKADIRTLFDMVRRNNQQIYNLTQAKKADPENGRGSSPSAEGRTIRGKTLADVASGFEGVSRLSQTFQEFVKNDLPKMRHEGEIKSQAYLKILGEVKRYLQKDILTVEEMIFVDQMTESFMKGIKEKLAKNKLSVDARYGDIKFMNEVFGKVVENMSNEALNLYNKDTGKHKHKTYEKNF